MNEILFQVLYYGYQVLTYYYYIIILQVILSWTPLINSKFYEILTKVTGVYMNVFRGWVVIKQIDLTPIVGLLIYQGILYFIGTVLASV